MIELQGVDKYYVTKKRRTWVLDNCSVVFERGRNFGILGRNGIGKSTFLKLLCGAEAANSGAIYSDVSISWPLGFAGGVNSELSGSENARFIGELYGAEGKQVTNFVRAFSELGDKLEAPVKSYSSGMRARLQFAISMAIEFDCYLIDELTAVGDRNFQSKCRAEFAKRRKRSDIIIVSHQISTIREYCDYAGILYGGNLMMFDDVEAAIQSYFELEDQLSERGL